MPTHRDTIALRSERLRRLFWMLEEKERMLIDLYDETSQLWSALSSGSVKQALIRERVRERICRSIELQEGELTMLLKSALGQADLPGGIRERLGAIQGEIRRQLLDIETRSRQIDQLVADISSGASRSHAEAVLGIRTLKAYRQDAGTPLNQIDGML